MAVTQLRRDSFARTTLMRDSFNNRPRFTNNPPCECKWCGQTPRTLYRYRWEDDGIYARIRGQWSPLFCGVGCASDFGAIS